MWTCPRHQPEGLLIHLQPQHTKRVLIIYQPAASRKSLSDLSYCEEGLNSGGYAVVIKNPTAQVVQRLPLLLSRGDNIYLIVKRTLILEVTQSSLSIRQPGLSRD